MASIAHGIFCKSKKDPPSKTGEPIQIVKYHPEESGTARFEYMDEDVKKIFRADDVKDKKAVIVSIAGAARKGKSFMLGYFMKFLENPVTPEWNENEQCKGFEWRGGNRSITTGLWIWSEPFISTSASGEEIAVFLMDSQGFYDRDSSIHDATVIFAFSILFSSIQVYNLMQDVQYVDLEHLEMFVKFGNYVESQDKFQRLVLLVRDWRSPQDFQYGEYGGKQFLESSILKKNYGGNANQTHNRIPEMLETFFDEVDCFLLPYPGDVVSTGLLSEYTEYNGSQSNAEYEGELKWMSKKFRNNLMLFLPFLLCDKNLKPKTIRQEEPTCQELEGVFEKLSQKLNQGDVRTLLHSLKPCFQGMVSEMYTTLKSRVCEDYRVKMNKVLETYNDPEDLHELHLKIIKDALKKIPDKSRKLFKDHLNKCIDRDVNYYFDQQYKTIKEKTSIINFVYSCSKTAIKYAGGGLGAAVGVKAGLAVASVAAVGTFPAAIIVTTGGVYGILIGFEEAYNFSKPYVLYSMTALKNYLIPKGLKVSSEKKEHED